MNLLQMNTPPNLHWFRKVFMDNFQSKTAFHLLLLILLPILIYVQSVKFDYTNFDDNGIILQKFDLVGNIHHIDTAFKVDAFFNPTGDFYRPVQNISFMLDAQVSREKLWMFHITNLIIHILTCISIYYFLPFLNIKKYTAFLMALLYSIHPLFASGVAWIPSRGDILIGVLGLQLFITFALYFRTKNIAYLIAHILLFLVTIFTKETTVFFPILFLYYYYFFVENKFNIKNLLRLIPFGVAWLGIFIFFFTLRKRVVAKSGAPVDVLGIIPFFKNNTVIPTIIGKFFVPFNLSTFPLYNNTSTIIGLIFLLGILYFTFEYSIEKKWAALLGLLWFVLFAIPPTIYRLQNADIFFNYLEHRTYLPMIGVVIILALLIDDHILSPVFYQRFIWAYIPIVLLFSVLAFIHCRDYKDGYSVNNCAAKLNNPSALAGRAGRDLEIKDTTMALEDINKAIELNPTDPNMFFQRGKIMSRMFNHKAAEENFSMALSMQPYMVDALLARSIELRYLHKYDAAFRDIFQAASIDPNNPKVFYSFGNLQAATKNYKEADSCYSKVIKLSPKYADAYNNRAYCKLMQGDYQNAITDCNQALQLMGERPSPIVFNNLGQAYRELNKLDTALVCFNRAIDLDNHFAQAYFERGKAYLKFNQIENACMDWHQSDSLGYKDTTGMGKKYCNLLLK